MSTTLGELSIDSDFDDEERARVQESLDAAQAAIEKARNERQWQPQ